MNSRRMVGVALTSCLALGSVDDVRGGTTMRNSTTDQDRYVGMWVTADGHIRHDLLPGGRYDESRGSRKSAYRGRYVLTGDHIDYSDDTGFTADGVFRDGVLYHAGMVLRREPATKKERAR